MSSFSKADYACDGHIQDFWVDDSIEDWSFSIVSSLSSAFKPSRNPHAQEISEQLSSIGQLQDGWDGGDANSISAATISAAREIIGDLRLRCRNRSGELPVPMIYACPDGSIDIYWNLPNRKILANVSASGSFEFAIKTSDGLRISGGKKHILSLVDNF